MAYYYCQVSSPDLHHDISIQHHDLHAELHRLARFQNFCFIQAIENFLEIIGQMPILAFLQGSRTTAKIKNFVTEEPLAYIQQASLLLSSYITIHTSCYLYLVTSSNKQHCTL